MRRCRRLVFSREVFAFALHGPSSYEERRRHREPHICRRGYLQGKFNRCDNVLVGWLLCVRHQHISSRARISSLATRMPRSDWCRSKFGLGIETTPVSPLSMPLRLTHAHIRWIVLFAVLATILDSHISVCGWMWRIKQWSFDAGN